MYFLIEHVCRRTTDSTIDFIVHLLFGEDQLDDVIARTCRPLGHQVLLVCTLGGSLASCPASFADELDVGLFDEIVVLDAVVRLR